MKPLALIGVLAGCTAGATYATSESAIVGGTRSTGMTTTVMVVAYPTNLSTYYTCTGVVIASNVVLTAAHCVDHPGYAFGVFTGDDATPYAASATTLVPQLEPVSATHIAPGYSTAAPFYADLGVVIMAGSLAIAPADYQVLPQTSAVTGMQATIIGYGQTVPSTNNYARYEATTTIGALEDDTLVIGDDTKHGCLGDSGGPAFLGTVVIGIDSYGPTNCTGASHYRRPDAFADFINFYARPPLSDDVSWPEAGTDAATNGNTGGGGCGGCAADGRSSAGMLLIGLVMFRRRRR